MDITFPRYAPPEFFNESKYHELSDVWSFGGIMLYLMTGVEIWSKLNSEQIKMYVKDQTKDGPVEYFKKNGGVFECMEIEDIIRGCLEREPDERFKPKEIIQELKLLAKIIY